MYRDNISYYPFRERIDCPSSDRHNHRTYIQRVCESELSGFNGVTGASQQMFAPIDHGE